ncbi:MAG: glutaredoxin family protein [Steroidobacteraceae bacterium]
MTSHYSVKSLQDWVVLSRPECSLCEAMCTELVELLGEQAAAIQVRDISGDPDLEHRYGTRIPVLLIDGDFICAYRLDRERLRPYLGD